MVRGLAGDGRDGTELVRFADDAEHVARFAADLVDGLAWARWYHGRFAEYRPLGRRAALRAVLLARLEDVPAILGWLRRHGALERVLAELDDATLRLLWSGGAGPDAVRPLAAAALRIAERLGLLSGEPPAVDA